MFAGCELGKRVESAVAGGVGSFIGFYVMVVLAILIMSMAFDATGGSGGSSTENAFKLSDAAGTLFKAGLPTAIVGAFGGVVGTAFSQE